MRAFGLTFGVVGSGQRPVVCGVGRVLAKNHTKVVFFLDICKFFSNFVPDF